MHVYSNHLRSNNTTLQCTDNTIESLTSQGSVHESEKARHQQLMEVIGWFFFDLLMLGYVEDSYTGLSFRVSGGQAWAIYVEVCVSVNVHEVAAEQLEHHN